VCVRIVGSGRKSSLPTPKGNGRDVMYVCMNVLSSINIICNLSIFEELDGPAVSVLGMRSQKLSNFGRSSDG
jgi:hypothetical protein